MFPNCYKLLFKQPSRFSRTLILHPIGTRYDLSSDQGYLQGKRQYP